MNRGIADVVLNDICFNREINKAQCFPRRACATVMLMFDPKARKSTFVSSLSLFLSRLITRCITCWRRGNGFVEFGETGN